MLSSMRRHILFASLMQCVLLAAWGCSGSNVEAQRSPLVRPPVSPWSDSRNPYNDPFRNSPDVIPGGSGPFIQIPEPQPEDIANSSESGQSENCYKADAFTCEVERLIFEKTNAYRFQSRRKLLQYGWHLSYAARNWSMQQASRGGISHFGFPGARLRVLTTEFGIDRRFDVSGENVALTRYSSGSAESIATDFAEMWWGSDDHRSNMLGNFEAVGVGVYRNGRAWYATQIFGAE